MAIVVKSIQARTGYIKNATSADASGTEEIIAATASKQIKIRSLAINSGAAITVTIGQGETGGAVTAALVGPVSMAANSSVVYNFNPMMELDANTSLTVDASGAGNVCILAQGAIE